MSADAITEKILNSAKEKGEKSLDDARERRDRILEDRTRSLRSEIDTKRENDKKHLVEEIQQKISTLRMDEKSKTHNLKRKKVDITYQRVWEKIQDKVVKKQLIEKDLSAYAIKNDTIIVPSSDADFFTDDFDAAQGTYVEFIGDVLVGCLGDHKFGAEEFVTAF